MRGAPKQEKGVLESMMSQEERAISGIRSITEWDHDSLKDVFRDAMSQASCKQDNPQRSRYSVWIDREWQQDITEVFILSNAEVTVRDSSMKEYCIEC